MKRQIAFFFGTGIAILILTASTIDLNNLFPYASQTIPNYITKDHGVVADDALATLGRVLFYDKNLSANNTISCSSCHQQAFAFSDPAPQSVGLNGGLTGRHSMRLINTRFADEVQFFWDERAATLEAQTTQPIQDHVEMGFSGMNGDPTLNDLLLKLEGISYYQELFNFIYGDANVTEARIQQSLAQFIRSIQSFDSKFDTGLAMTNGNMGAPFPNFTAEENQGKQLFLAPPNNNGAGCQGCHRAPEFDIDPTSLNNGVIGIAGGGLGIDLTNTRAPSLRDLVNPSGVLNSPMMHTGGFTSLMQVINHYNQIPNIPANTNLDNRLNPPGPGTQNLNLSQVEKDALVAFLETLTGSAVYTSEQWSDPFDANGLLDVVLVSNTEILLDNTGISIYPNPTSDNIHIELAADDYIVQILDVTGTVFHTATFSSSFYTVDIAQLPTGVYFLQITNQVNQHNNIQTILKQ